MLIYLDTVIVIYAIEGAPIFQSRAVARLALANATGDHLVTSHLTRLECLVQPIRRNDINLLTEYSKFLGKTFVLPLPPLVYDRAAQIRALNNYPIADALHLATAIAGNCDLFLTNDARLAGFSDIAVEILP